MTRYEDILKAVEAAVTRFNKRIPAAQKSMLDAIEEDLRGLELNGSSIKATVKNMNLITRIKNRMTRILLSDQYENDVKEFTSAFNDVTRLQNEYWKSVEPTFKPRPLLREIKKAAVNDTVAKLTEAGIGVNIGDKVADILRTSITGGGSYASLADQLRQHLTSTNTPGALEKYAKQITTDALNQYNAQYTQTVSSDLGYEWFKYDNTDIETTRPFCDAMTDIKYFHISQVPALLRAEGLTYVNKKGDRVPVPIYRTTGLPHGMIAGTDASNFFVRRGGYNCGHQIRPVLGAIVPDDIKAKVMATPEYIRWAAAQRAAGKIDAIPTPPEAPPPPAVTPEKPKVGQSIVDKNKASFKSLKKSNIAQHTDLLDYLPKDDLVVIHDPNESGSYYDPISKRLHINSGDAARANNSYWRSRIVAHEIGHAIHNQNEIITPYKVDPGFAKLKKSLESTVRKHAVEIENKLLEIEQSPDVDIIQLVDVADVLACLTQGVHGWGHRPGYYTRSNGSEAELFVNGITFDRVGNKYHDVHPAMKVVFEKLREYTSQALQAIKQQS